MASKTGEFFKFLLIIQILFGLLLTTVVYFLPADARPFINPFSGQWTQSNAQTELSKTNGTLTNLKNQNPVMAGLGVAFLSGNYILDLLINSAFALPEMVSILFGGLFMFIPISPYIQATITVAAFAI